jgi:bleomycin hydrolase
MKGDCISLDTIDKMNEKFNKNPQNKILQNAISRTDIKKVSLNWDRFANISHTFSNVISNELPATSQNQSGRCWLFAILNLMRVHVARKHKLDDFELSQSYLFFWDKLEKANFFLESVIDTAKENYDSRLVMCIFDSSFLFQDGGQWHMAVNLIEKYGVVPQSVFPDNEAALNSREFNQIFKLKLRQQGVQLRNLIALGNSKSHILEIKNQMIEEIHHMLLLHMGNPPKTFDWEFTNKEKKYHIFKNLNPKSFLKEHVKINLKDFVCLVNSPRKSTPYYETFTVKYLGNVVEGDPILYLNVPIEEMKKATVDSLKDDEPVWFGCDVGKSFHRDLGIMDLKLYDLDLAYNVSFESSKEDRMNYGESQMTHAMLFTGVNLLDHKPNRYRVENSWGDKVGKKGYFIMTDEWFDEYMFEVAINKKYLEKKLLKNLEKKPMELEPWDPLGALA